ncbi:MAG: hypothetical protein AAFR36_02170 [Bacteroidota bacterium]
MSFGVFITNNINLPVSGLEGVSQVVVQEKLGQTTTFQLHFPVDIQNGDLTYLSDLSLDPGSVLGINVTSGLLPLPECLVKGPVYGQNIDLVSGGEGSTLVVHGADTSIIMARQFKSQSWANVTDSEAVALIVGQYGLVPDTSSTNTRHLETKHVLVQRSNDLDFVRQLARRNGYYFWISCNSVGIETAHFKRPNLTLPATVSLSINNPEPSLNELSISWNVERPTSVEGTQLDLSTKTPMPGLLPLSPQTGLGTMSLLAITQDTRSAHVAAPADDIGNMLARAEGTLISADWFITARAKTSLHQTGGQLVRAHQVIDLQGAGSRHSGKYLVSGVKHIITASSHEMEIELIRNAWNPSIPGGII